MTHFQTDAVHAGYNPSEHNNSVAVPIYQTSAYTYDSAKDAADLFDLKKFGNIYSRLTNPTVDIWEKRIAKLEGGVAALAVSSGHSAQFIAITNICEKGDNFISSNHLYGGSYTQFSVTFKKQGIDARFFTPGEEHTIEDLIDDKTRAIFFESLANPSFSIVDFEKITKIAQKYHIPIIVDNTVPSPALFNPFAHGANIIVHSSSKILGGQGTSIGGVIVDGGNFDWGKNNRFPSLTQPSEGYHGLIFNDVFGVGCPFGNIAFIIKARVEGLRDYGNCLSPFNAFLFLQGIETLFLRTQSLSKNIIILANFLDTHPKVKQVFTPLLESSPYHEKFQKYFKNGAPGILSFELHAGRKAGEKFIESVKIAQHVTNLGDSKTLVTHPASTTHRQLSNSDLKTAEISQGLIRVSLGLENINDIISDFKQALG